ncbi:MAG: alginate export family protein [Saprospiraceae bacterium]|jgi:hypothetical protein|nr:alginate export family protein [Saprospiraceae bacterium]MBL0261887.1 alginate export family protein [Saprospiraceae bacterium]
MKKILTISLSVLCAFVHTLSAQTFTLSGEFRPRTEYAHGLKTLAAADQDPGFFTTQRSRLNLKYGASKMTAYLSLQDVRTWGNQSQLNENEDRAVSIHEAWIMPTIGKGAKWALKIGRQEIVYDDHRIFGNVGWAQSARSHDALLLKYSPSAKSSLDIGLAYNQDIARLNSNLYLNASNYKTMQYLWYHTNFSKLGVSLLALNLGMQVLSLDSNNVSNQETKFNQTLGTHLNYKTGKFTILANLYYQLGKRAISADQDISAYLLGLDLGYAINAKNSITLGYELQSGSSQVDPSEKLNSFTPWYGTNHKFNGHMDYFYVGNHLNSVGLQDIYVKWNTKFSKCGLGADLHYFSAAADVKKPGTQEAAPANLGTELDLYLDFMFSDAVKCQLGYSQMLATETLGYLKGGKYNETQNWAWVMLSYTPTFLKHEVIKQ